MEMGSTPNKITTIENLELRSNEGFTEGKAITEKQI